jgi:hypothetical protein
LRCEVRLVAYSSEYYRDLASRLMALRVVFSTCTEDRRYVELFDEFLAVNELELALHQVCDFLNEPTTPDPSDAVLDQIRGLHATMELNDDCVEKLTTKVEGG